MTEQSATDVQWFPANGQATGIAVVVLVVVVAVLCVFSGVDPGVPGALLVFGVLAYVTLLRPRVGTTTEDLVVRRMFSELRIPLTSVEHVRVTRFFEATVAGRPLISPAVGRSRRALRARRKATDDPRDPGSVYADLVEDTVRARMRDARSRARSGAEAREVRRTWAWPEVAAGVAALVVFLVLLFAF